MAFIVFTAIEWNGIPGQSRDTIAYYTAAAAARSGAAIYEPLPAPGPHEFDGRWHYLYPPPLAALLAALPHSSYRTFDRGWLLLNGMAFWVLAAALGRLARGRWSPTATARWGAALFFLPGTLLVIHFGNIELMILALVGIGLAVPAAGGAAIGLAAAFKVTPVWALATLSLRRPRQTIPGIAVAGALCIGACTLMFGMMPTVALLQQWVRDVMPAVAQGQFWGGSLVRLQEGGLRVQDYLSNLSVPFMPVQIAVMSGWWDYDGGPLPSLVRGYLALVGVGAPLMTAWLTRRATPETQAAWVLAAALLSAPIVRPYALPVILLVVAAVKGQSIPVTDESDPGIAQAPAALPVPHVARR